MVKIRTLVISSDPELVRFLKKEPFSNSYQVTCTPDTGEGLREVVGRESPELFIVDVMMPRLDGVEISLRVRQWSQAPIIMLSAWEAGQGSVRRFDLSAESYLSKPLDIDEVIALVERAFENNRTALAMKLSQDARRAVTSEKQNLESGGRLQVKCAWCGIYMGERDGYGVHGVTHSICEQCSAELQGARRTAPAVPNPKYN